MPKQVQIAWASSMKRGGNPQVSDGFDSEFVVAAAKVLYERESGDDDRRGAVGA